MRWGASAVAAGAYGWWASGLRPFTWTAYAAVGLLVAVVSGTAIARRGSRAASDASGTTVNLRRAWPWIALCAAAVVLEVVGLALGGRSAAVPTLSTVVDRALAPRAARCAMYVAWLAVGIAPVVAPRHAATREAT